MVNILEQYFVQYHELILTDIGTLQFTHQPAQWVVQTGARDRGDREILRRRGQRSVG